MDKKTRNTFNKSEERKRKRANGLVPVQEWVHVEDAPKLKLYAIKLRDKRDALNEAFNSLKEKQG